jgi:hypothetical protein
VNGLPPDAVPPEDADELYRRAARSDHSAPSEATRRAVLGYAEQLARERGRDALAAAPPAPVPRPAAGSHRALKFGGLAAAALTAALFAPRLLQTPPHSPAPSAPADAVPEPAPPPAPEMPQTATAPASAPRQPPATARREAPAAGIQAGRIAERALLAAPSTRALQSHAAASPRAFPNDTPLGQAAEGGNVQALTAALDAGEPIDARDAQGRTALMRAVQGRHLDAAELLLRRGADPNAADARGQRPLAAARALQAGALAALLEHYGAR